MLNLKMNVVEKSCADIEHNFFVMFLNMEFHKMDSTFRKVFTPKAYKRLMAAMRFPTPTPLSKKGEAALEMYEDHVTFLFTVHQGHHVEC